VGDAVHVADGIFFAALRVSTFVLAIASLWGVWATVKELGGDDIGGDARCGDGRGLSGLLHPLVHVHDRCAVYRVHDRRVLLHRAWDAPERNVGRWLLRPF
jgi:hypothetical protein